MNQGKGVDSISHENIAESEKSITDEVIELLFPSLASDFSLVNLGWGFNTNCFEV